MVKKKPAAQATTAENETVKVETKAAEKTTAAEKEAVKEAVKEVAKEVVKETAAAEEAPAKAEEKPAAKAAKTTRTTAKKTTSSSEKAGREKSTCKSSKEISGAGDDSAVRRKRNQGERSVRENPADLDRRIWQESRGIKEPEGLCKTGGIYCLLRNQ